MKEKCSNVFVYVNGPNERVTEFGVVVHELDGSDSRKMRHLQLSVADDFAAARRFPVPKVFGLELTDGTKLFGTIDWHAYRTLAARNQHMHIFEPAFQEIGAPHNPLMVVTAVVDGTPRVEAVVPVWAAPE